MNIPTAIPKKPAMYPSNMKTNRLILIVKFSEKSGMLNEQIAVIATIIINIGLTKFALTAASPKINPPHYSNCWTNWGGNTHTSFTN